MLSEAKITAVIIMIRRTVLEWKSLPYGEGADQIPELMAERLLAVARALSLGGEEGANILTRGHRQIKAKQVVGVIVAEGCCLEILPKIDFPSKDEQIQFGGIRQRLVHMLAVALDINIDVGATTDLDWQRDTLLEILISVFSSKLADAVRQGMPRRYVAHEEDLPTLRGRLDVIRQFTKLAVSPQILACRYDELSPDIALNQIMKATVSLLLKVSRSASNQRRLRELAFAYADITEAPRQALRWDDVVLDRTNARWRELLEMARLFLGQRFQTTSAGGGRGFSLLFEMNTLFEEYVGRIAKKAFKGCRVTLQGPQKHLAVDTRQNNVIALQPDVVGWQEDKDKVKFLWILDTKWKPLSVEKRRENVQQADLYQMYAYASCYDCSYIVILYPHHRELDGEAGVRHTYKLNPWAQTDEPDRLVRVATIDLSDLKTVQGQLSEIMEIALSRAD
ncbi:MAG: McrC family protein [Azonexus sp.]|jgi:5-methylcytosine-specific restriction enzyme subunit McrC|nr:McrC family protein [Azonexus sp.]